MRTCARPLSLDCDCTTPPYAEKECARGVWHAPQRFVGGGNLHFAGELRIASLDLTCASCQPTVCADDNCPVAKPSHASRGALPAAADECKRASRSCPRTS